LTIRKAAAHDVDTGPAQTGTRWDRRQKGLRCRTAPRRVSAVAAR